MCIANRQELPSPTSDRVVVDGGTIRDNLELHYLQAEGPTHLEYVPRVASLTIIIINFIS